ncbi:MULTISPECIES: aminoacetone oxidase family FAD-binding enzyme [Caproicibacterium]|uniref:Aminoacetone oxidase family FAD-binding enzyme n=1 Tax=Caproicibacterium argilliputei TaxID=3030016 RepID=A0AA97DAU0_9FIRM|nr:aminoacetone oxidase family FAD-binding enzyme [Caproicibacterium argilliputei]WOC33424.1 aminoacetone oxidase family FAD-binding enzyme [Caproicibacterium argilliputei]
MPKTYTLAVIGGGASGLLGAVRAAQLLGGKQVILLEAAPRVGKKLLATGNGRCNLTNLRVDVCHYHGDTVRAQKLLTAFPPQRILAYFQQLGLLCREQSEGRVYPYSMQSATVLNVLRGQLSCLGVAEQCGFAVQTIQRRHGDYRVQAKTGECVLAKYLLLSTGGLAQAGAENGYSLLEQLHHSTTPLKPALAPVRVREVRLVRSLKGVRTQAAVTLSHGGKVLRQTKGEVQFTEHGLSGICIFELSRDALPGDVISLDLVPEYSLPQLQKLTGGRLDGVLHKALAQVCPFEQCKHFCFTVEQAEDFRHAQVTAGGVPLEQLDNTCQSLFSPGVWLTGELLNVDGDCGGFNLHWAWSTALCAAQAIFEEAHP